MINKPFKRTIGYLLYYGIGKHLPCSYSAINLGQRRFRGLCGKLLLHKCGEDVNIEHGAVFSMHCELGDRADIGVNAKVGKCVIGNDVMMAPNVLILTQNHNFDDSKVPMNQQGNTEIKPVVIGDDVWIGARVTILPGVKIGNHSIIGAASVVTKDVPGWSIVAGNPGKVIKMRNRGTTS